MTFVSFVIDEHVYAMDPKQRCSLCREGGHNRTTCIRRLHGRIERVEEEILLKKAEVDRLQIVVANLKVEEIRRQILSDQKDQASEQRQCARASTNRKKKEKEPTSPPDIESASDCSDWGKNPEKESEDASK